MLNIAHALYIALAHGNHYYAAVKGIIGVKLTSIKQSPLLSSHGHPFLGPNKFFLIVFTHIKQ